MKIDELNQNSAAAYLAAVRSDKQPETADTQSDASAKKQPASDKVDLSSFQTASAVTELPSDKTVSRVDALKAQIAAGTYQVPGRAVAEKMLSKIVLH